MNLKKIYRNLLRYGFKRNCRNKLKNQNFTIISQNCIGGIIYNTLGERFLSPTINCWMNASDFIKYCNNLKYYNSLKLVQNEQKNLPYPVGNLDDVQINFTHYNSFKEAKECWERRVKRINYDNLFIVMTQRDGCDKQDLMSSEIENVLIFSKHKH